ncbi:MAG: N-acetyl-1-D-myo-inositol-2-amino-2-deoxy-alpha-D-glucopyranoside deacetylase [Roseiflexaceae bacterium]|nr:N-acetyl-1-D-myo-inositol-2-amino-2-deoxy-alpha-D-glucopyranoside deacetylase [Roseiflexaceae bacterium]
MTTYGPLCVLFIHAHPDDECLSTGGVLARYSAEGIHTVLTIATGGEEGEIVVPALDTPANHARLREIRDGELACSVAHLGVKTLERLGYRDSGMVDTEANSHPESFHMADKDQAAGRVVALIRRYRPQVLVTYDERGGYGHPDHIACHAATVAAFAAAGDPASYPDAGEAWTPLKLYYTAFPRRAMLAAWQEMKERGLETPLDTPEFDITRFTQEDEVVTTTVPIQDYTAQKNAAITCHITQIRSDGPFRSMPEDIALRMFGVEHFTLAQTRLEAPAGLEDDLFADLR